MKNGRRARADPIFEQLPHQIGRSGLFRTDSDRCSTQVGKVMETIARFSEEEQRLLIRQAAEQTEICSGGHRCTVLDEGEHLVAVAVVARQPANILDRSFGRDDRQHAMAAFGARRQSARQCVVIAAGRAAQNRRVQIPKIARYPESGGNSGNRGGDGLGGQDATPRGVAASVVRIRPRRYSAVMNMAPMTTITISAANAPMR